MTLGKYPLFSCGHIFLGKRLKTHRNHLSKVQILTLPLTEESVLHHSYLVSKIDMLAPWKRLRENVRHLLISRYILKLHCSLLNPITYEVIFDLYVFSPVMKYWILREFNATLLIAINHGGT